MELPHIRILQTSVHPQLSLRQAARIPRGCSTWRHAMMCCTLERRRALCPASVEPLLGHS